MFKDQMSIRCLQNSHNKKALTQVQDKNNAKFDGIQIVRSSLIILNY